MRIEKRLLPLWGLLIVTLGVVFGGGCRSFGSAGDLARTVGTAFVQEEDELLDTCNALERAAVVAPPSGAGGPGAWEPGAADSAVHLTAHLVSDRRARARALVSLAAPSATSNVALADADLDALLACPDDKACAETAGAILGRVQLVVGGDGAKILEHTMGATLTAESLLTGLRTLLPSLHFAQATVFGLARVSELVEDLIDDVADGFGFFKAFASPLLKYATAELIASGMDVVLSELETQSLVSPASVALQACRVYRRIDPSARVTGRVMRRAILRFSPKKYATTSGLTAACGELEKQKGDPVCQEIFEDHLGLAREGASIETTEGLERILEPTVAPAALNRPVSVADAHHAAFREAARMCLAEDENPRRCTLARVAQAASWLVVLRLDHPNGQWSFGDVEARVASLTSTYEGLASGVEELNARYGELTDRVAALTDAESGLRALYQGALDPNAPGGLHAHLTDAERRIKEALPRPSTPQPRCGDYIRKVMAARDAFARDDLGVTFDGCRSNWDAVRSPSATYKTRFTGVTASHDELCEQRLVTVGVQIDFPDHATARADELWECPKKGCLDPAFRDLLQNMASKNPANLVFVGSSDSMLIVNKKAILSGWSAKKSAYPADPLPGVLSPAPTDEELQRVLSMLRVLSVTEEVDPTKKLALGREALGQLGQARRVRVRIAKPELALDLAGNCRN